MITLRVLSKFKSKVSVEKITGISNEVINTQAFWCRWRKHKEYDGGWSAGGVNRVCMMFSLVQCLIRSVCLVCGFSIPFFSLAFSSTSGNIMYIFVKYVLPVPETCADVCF